MASPLADHIGWVKDPELLPNVTRDRPDRTREFVIVGRYDDTPKGGRKANPDGPWIWCCECQEANHWNGFVVSDGSGRLFLIGGDCGRAHYGGDRFTIARRSFENIERRERLLARRRALIEASSDLLREAAALIASEALGQIERKRLELQRASPNALARLSSAILAGGNLTTHQVGRLDQGRERAMHVQVGRVEGEALVRTHVRFAATELKGMLAQEAEVTDEELEQIEVKAIVARVRPIERACEDLIRERDMLASAPDFFRDRNLRRLESWAAPMRKFFVFEVEPGSRLRIWDHVVGDTLIEPLGRIDVPRLPACMAIVAATAEQ